MSLTLSADTSWHRCASATGSILTQASFTFSATSSCSTAAAVHASQGTQASTGRGSWTQCDSHIFKLLLLQPLPFVKIPRTMSWALVTRSNLLDSKTSGWGCLFPKGHSTLVFVQRYSSINSLSNHKYQNQFNAVVQNLTWSTGTVLFSWKVRYLLICKNCLPSG